ncbi:TBC1 domain family member 25 isoform X2 [Pseudoliparis swirei]|uniref:TBC1 domain family member 25 isoform X2 n=1 Tax=Pseudoliparis swirei TaxID=2059687 RepID=UPI0024BE5F52|nr:TBC1 domain family member 25 isoform X2 [Pseudoliparis swirei]
MAGEERGVVRVRVKKCDGVLPVEFRSFAVDPQITSLEVLQHILIRAFELSGRRSFGMSYLSRDRSGAEMFLPLLSDWDLDLAFVSAAKPYLQLKMDVKPSEDSPVMEDWDIISPKDVIGSEQLLAERTRSLANAALPFTQSLLCQVGRTLSKVQQAFSWSYGEEIKPFHPPLSDAEFHHYLNGQGQLTRPDELRLRIYHGGVDPSLRKVVWRYLLNVYPDGLTGQERMDYMKRMTREYDQLKREWPARVSAEDLDFIRGSVLKDVLRTDRAHPYYAGSEDSPHLGALTDLLTTFAITHPQISYCQGMSDLASPILAVMDNEAHAFVCFCGIMKRLEGNFQPDGRLMAVKFQHLKLLLRYSDPEFYSYLVSRGADDLFFCYRWLLLELKREFTFDDALRMLEVTWSSLPPDPPETEVELRGPPGEPGRPESGPGDEERRKEKRRRRHMLRPSREERDEDEEDEGGEEAPPSERKTSFGEFKYYTARHEDSFHVEEAGQTGVPRRQSTADSEEDPEERTPLIKTCEDSSPSPPAAWRTVPSESPASPASSSSWPGASLDSPEPTANESEAFPRTVPKAPPPPAHMLSSTGMNSPTTPTVRTAVASPTFSRSLLSSPISSFGRGSPPPGCLEAEAAGVKPCSLPPPQEFGKGNPFMLFLCLSILLEHRDHIIKNGLDYNELAMHFDRLVRRHNLSRVLRRAKALFADYLQSEVWDSEEGDEVSSDSPTAAGPRSPSSPNSTYNMATAVPSPTAHLFLSPTS